LGQNTRLVFLNLLDALLLNLAMFLALLLRFDGRIPPAFVQGYLGIFYYSTILGLLCLNLFKVHRTLWRYAGLPTALSIVNALTVAYICFYVVNQLVRPQALPRSVLILTWILAIALVLGVRLLWKVLRNPARRGTRTGRKILIVGAGDIGAMVAREIARSVGYSGHPVGFVDDDPRKQGARVENLEVLGRTFDLPRLLSERQIGEVIIAAPSAPGRLLHQVARVCMEGGAVCRTVPALADYIEGKGALDQVREVRIEDLLGRDPIEIDLPGIRQWVEGKIVLVTGAGGSIGSELCRQIARFAPQVLVMLDHNENSLTYLGLELRESRPKLNMLHVVGDIKDEIGMQGLFAAHGPDVVFHAAAHKHVNLLESSPREAILNNVLGTRNVARACDATRVGTLVLISTDKAVNPTSVMGASKRLCEMLLQALARDSSTTMVTVRFGNVIGSEGSVLPIFRRQLARGGPLTVTHPDARRYFMTIPEASQLVIQAGLLGSCGDVFILDMGEPVRILDVARQLIRLSGLEPDRDIRVEFIGLRPGEKLEEEILTHSERTRMTLHSKIFRCVLEEVDHRRLVKEVEELIELAVHGSPDEIRHGLKRLVPDFNPVAPPALPLGEPAVEKQPAAAAGPAQEDPVGKRAMDVAAAAVSLVVLAVPAAIAWALVHLSGPSKVIFCREERIGLNRRSTDRRIRPSRVGIDRRDTDRRQRTLPGRPFVTYVISVHSPERASGLQRRMARIVQTLRLDRVLYLWSVLRGDMSLVGPSAHLLESETWQQDEISAWCFARRPGLTGPAQILGGAGEEALHYDRYYGSHGNWKLDLDSLRLALPHLFRSREGGEPAGRDPVGASASSGSHHA
jgi:FlaA1/EpsC-like NDP-sugar epimerase/lipopolysaccharide/colanic/teichoic acid biosynthesis glycosyltransferase